MRVDHSELSRPGQIMQAWYLTGMVSGRVMSWISTIRFS